MQPDTAGQARSDPDPPDGSDAEFLAILPATGAEAARVLALSVRNLFDREYETVSGFDWRPASGVAQDGLRMDGRSVWLQVGYAL